MSQNVLPWRFLRAVLVTRRARRFAAGATLTGLFSAQIGCDAGKSPRPERSPFLRPLVIVSAPAASASAPLAPLIASSSALAGLERPPDPDPDPAGPPGDLRAEIDAFQDLRACARAHRLTDPLVAEGLDALGYDTFLTDSCRTIEALKARDVAPCAPMLSTALRHRCEASVAMLTGRPELCPAEDRIPGVPERAPLCLAAARRDVRPCAALLGLDRATCEGLAAHDPARCGVDERCLRQVRRWMTTIPVAIGRPPHAGQIQVELRATSDGQTDSAELPREAEIGAIVAVRSEHTVLLIGDPRTFFLVDELSGGGIALKLPSWPPQDARLTLTDLEARVTLRLRQRGALELTRGSKVTVTFESAPVEPNRPLKLRVEATVGPSHAPRRSVWNIDTWLRDTVLPASAASAAPSSSAGKAPPAPSR